MILVVSLALVVLVGIFDPSCVSVNFEFEEFVLFGSEGLVEFEVVCT